MKAKSDFLRIVYHAIVDLANAPLRDALTRLRREMLSLKEPPLLEYLEGVGSTIFALQNIGEFDWVATIAENAYNRLRAVEKPVEAQGLLRSVIDTSFSRGAYQAVIQCYAILADEFQWDGVSLVPDLADLWLEAATRFRGLSEYHFVTALTELNRVLPVPDDEEPSSFTAFLKYKSILWALGSGVVIADEEDFWYTILYRAIYEEDMGNCVDLAVRMLRERCPRFTPELVRMVERIRTSAPAYCYELPDLSNQNIILRLPDGAPIKIIVGDQLQYTQDYVDDSSTVDFWDEVRAGQIKNVGIDLVGQISFLAMPLAIRNIVGCPIPEYGQEPNIFVISDSILINFERMTTVEGPLGLKLAIG
jgi:hypothetical protein